MTTPTRSLQAMASGFRLPWEGARMLVRERRLWALAVVPLLLSLAALAAALTVVTGWAPEIYGWATDWMPVLEANHWYAWLWVGPARLGLALLGGILFLVIAGVCLVAAYLVASVLASPFHDALSLRVERIINGEVLDDTASGLSGVLREGARSVREELRRIAFFLSIVIPLAALGFVVPGGQLVTGPLIAAFTIFFLPLDYASYTLDRRHVSFPEKRRWLLTHKPVAAGFGVAAFLLLWVPVLNLMAMPLLVVAGTLLVLRHQPEGAASPVSR